MEISVEMFDDDVKIRAWYNEQNDMLVHSASSCSIDRMLEWSNDNDMPLYLQQSAVLHFGRISSTEYEIDHICTIA